MESETTEISVVSRNERKNDHVEGAGVVYWICRLAPRLAAPHVSLPTLDSLSAPRLTGPCRQWQAFETVFFGSSQFLLIIPA